MDSSPSEYGRKHLPTLASLTKTKTAVFMLELLKCAFQNVLYKLLLLVKVFVSLSTC